MYPDFDDMSLQINDLFLSPNFDNMALRTNYLLFRIRQHTPTWCCKPAPGTTAAPTPARNSKTLIFMVFK